MKKTVSFAILSAIALLSACSGSSNKADKSAFEKAINQYAEKTGVCLPVVLNIRDSQGVESHANTTVGEPVIQVAEKDINGEKINREALSQIDVLEEEGFYKETDSTTVPSASGKDIKIRQYELTEKGNAQTQPNQHGPLFCIGKQTVEKINWFTEPTPNNGVTISKVSYEAEFKPEGWAKKLLDDDSGNWQQIARNQSQTATLVQTNDGWRDIRELH